MMPRIWRTKRSPPAGGTKRFAPSRNVQCRRMSRQAVVQQHPCIPFR
ncbi:hypothetical protein PgNI_05538 [Pyricularia grisea]|uniref:Uncharacterized protein n=1 Tax=Pyricularia grisea TaxID=148305 RepID=A0A6P8B452_PYRGI|nr:hypothetical protein PgNI_05538 [Pyricularia grisea]TLD10025.1 hypothetical protein PgNI_05538 [Pyricularia grisea]